MKICITNPKKWKIHSWKSDKNIRDARLFHQNPKQILILMWKTYKSQNFYTKIRINKIYICSMSAINKTGQMRLIVNLLWKDPKN
jgi:hypothetical protein